MKVINFLLISALILVFALQVEIHLSIPIIALASICFIYRNKIIMFLVKSDPYYLIFLIIIKFSASMLILHGVKTENLYGNILVIFLILISFVIFAIRVWKYDDNREYFLKDLPIKLIGTYIYAIFSIIYIPITYLAMILILLFIVLPQYLYYLLGQNWPLKLKIYWWCKKIKTKEISSF